MPPATTMGRAERSVACSLVVDVSDVSVGGSSSWSRWLGLRMGLIVAWVGLLLGAVTFGERPANQAEAGMVGIWGMDVPLWLGAVALVYLVLGLFCLVQSPEPWRATRWAWFWLSSSPFGWLAYLLLSGPIPGIAGPPQHGARLRGEWAFIISSVVGAVSVNLGLR